ncbi:MAG: D-alanine-D-alanine ligase [Blastocatellia bacterium]|nr:D-alanine-D-alanine ligase [Blastocatellia bacterium]
MAKKIRVGVIFGGRSSEHEVSVRSAGAVIQAIDRRKYDVVPIAINKKGKWLPPALASALLPDSAQQFLSKEALSGSTEDVAIVGDPSRSGLVSLHQGGKESEAQSLDVIFPVLHGPYGEDGTLQGLLEMASIPFVGCGTLASACGMDKVAMKALFENAGLPMCEYTWVLRSEWQRQPDEVLRRLKRKFKGPLFVKPANLGSSVGISKVTSTASLKRALDLAARYDRKLIVEQGIDGREIECAVMGNDEPEASLPGEYLVREKTVEFLDYTEKYASTGNVEFVVPAPISKTMIGQIRKLAVKAFQAIDGAGLARVDFFLERSSGRLMVNEINTLPGLTDVSGFPKMWAASGRSFPDVLDRLIQLGLERHRDRARNEVER